jgi:hypothetical protein
VSLFRDVFRGTRGQSANRGSWTYCAAEDEAAPINHVSQPPTYPSLRLDRIVPTSRT